MELFLVFYVGSDGDDNLEKIFDNRPQAEEWVEEQKLTTSYGHFEIDFWRVEQ